MSCEIEVLLRIRGGLQFLDRVRRARCVSELERSQIGLAAFFRQRSLEACDPRDCAPVPLETPVRVDRTACMAEILTYADLDSERRIAALSYRDPSASSHRAGPGPRTAGRSEYPPSAALTAATCLESWTCRFER